MDIVGAPGSRSVGAFRGMPLFCDVTIVSTLSRTGAPRGSSHNIDGNIVEQANRRKRRTYRDVATSGSAHFLVLGMEVNGRWHQDTLQLIKQLAYHKSADAPSVLRKSAQQAWSRRWWNIVSVGCMKAVGEALLFERGPGPIHNIQDSNIPYLADVLSP